MSATFSTIQYSEIIILAYKQTLDFITNTTDSDTCAVYALQYKRFFRRITDINLKYLIKI
jgi:hypothetical protein